MSESTLASLTELRFLWIFEEQRNKLSVGVRVLYVFKCKNDCSWLLVCDMEISGDAVRCSLKRQHLCIIQPLLYNTSPSVCFSDALLSTLCNHDFLTKRYCTVTFQYLHAMHSNDYTFMLCLWQQTEIFYNEELVRTLQYLCCFWNSDNYSIWSCFHWHDRPLNCDFI